MGRAGRVVLPPAGAIALLLACGSAEGERATAAGTPARTESGTTAPATAALATPGEPATCLLDEADPAPCNVSFASNGAGERTIRATLKDGRTVVFAGRSAGPWQSGTLDGAPAMGVEMNRGHLRFSTTALDRTFAYWTRGNEHGSY